MKRSLMWIIPAVLLAVGIGLAFVAGPLEAQPLPKSGQHGIKGAHRHRLDMAGHVQLA